MIAKMKAGGQKKPAASDFTEDPSSFDEYSNPFSPVRDFASNKGLLKSRIATARADGRLNVAAMGLKDIPDEVMNMYDFDPSAENVQWSEAVDLVKFIAADNEIEKLREDAFPDMTTEEALEDEKGLQFRGLESLDLHGNAIQLVPSGFRHFPRLTSLNLSSNRLGMECMDIISQIECLKELRLAKNKLEGSLSSAIGNMTALETLDLGQNMLTGLPDSLAGLVRLRILQLPGNQIVTIPAETLSSLPLVELTLSKNKLSGALLPPSVNGHPTLQILDVASNTLSSLSEKVSPDGELDFPCMQQLKIDFNRISSLPNIASWENLRTLTGQDNQISQLPKGFTVLKNLRTADFTGNNLSKIEPEIGFMDDLHTLIMANNPLRERRFLGLSTADLKTELRNRLAPLEDSTSSSKSVPDPLSPSTSSFASAQSSWPVKANGVLDRSSTNLTELPEEDLLSVLEENAVKTLIVHHNQLSSIPPTIGLISTTLTTLDLSHTSLSGDIYMSESLDLQCLQDLNLASNAITTLAPLISNLTAPTLKTINVSANRLTTLPLLRRNFPSLSAVVASDNRIAELSVAAVKGLKTLDITNNEIFKLPPKIGLLGGEESPLDPELRLRSLGVGGNPFKVPRWDVVEKGTDAVLAALRRMVPEGEGLDEEED